MNLFSSLAESLGGLFAGGAAAPLRRRSDNAFRETYRALPMAFSGKDHLDQGNKVILPSSALRSLTRSNIQYPMMFCVTNNITGQKTHVGVLEFSAPEGIAYLPLSCMDTIGLSTDQPLTFTSVVLPAGTYAKIQPHQTKFIDLSNPRAVLEKSLRSYSCLTKGDTIIINYADTEFFIDIVDVKPADAISLIDTDVQVEFEEPKDYKGVQAIAKAPASSSPAAAASSSIVAAETTTAPTTDVPSASSPLSQRPGGYRLNGKAVESPTPATPPSATTPQTDSGRRTTVVQGQWRYFYDTDPTTHRRRLIRREPVSTLSSPGRKLQ
jgi:ubiquitin fusion degradation protein 1